MIGPVSFGKHTLNQIEIGITKEWLETNGLGSYASGTILGANTRRTHALYVLPAGVPSRRMTMVNRLEEAVLLRDRRIDFSSQEYPGSVFPRGYLNLEHFSLEPFPRWVLASDDLKIEKTFFLRSGEDCAVLLYRHLMGPPVRLILRPFLSCRDPLSLIKEDRRFDGSIRAEGRRLWCAVPGAPSFSITALFRTESENGRIRINGDPVWYKNLVYAHDEENELDSREDLYVPGQILAELEPGQTLALVFSPEKEPNIHLDRWIEQELFARRKAVENVKVRGELGRICALAADQFIVRNGKGAGIVRGYPSKDLSMRDSLMCLPGICLATGRLDEAREILRNASKLAAGGLFHGSREPDSEDCGYCAVDPALWFVWAVQEFHAAAKDDDFLREMKPHVEAVVRSFSEGTGVEGPNCRCDVRMDSDGLIIGSSQGVPLTWMDARVNGWIATPRRGKAVEVQALWYNALQFCSEICIKFDGRDSGWGDLARKVRESFNLYFWNSQVNYLFDHIEGNMREGSIRPNALYAVSLPYEVLETDKFRPVVDQAWSALYTSLGLRTLSPKEPHFHAVHAGDERSRAASMHNGTVMSFLIGPFLTAFMKAYGRDAANRERAVHFLRPIMMHVADAGVGTISEMFDGDPPHTPRGGIADARAVGEILRVMQEEGLEI
ncbi:MAG: hypothetical protein A2902_03450 [Elusimicrobia bacterium RIFCSPLOWO2_01_FULL_64_13]|nr:MAG: hypothetical protein A2636_03770 [Elusimicrobia bacterium RIFCSPHIGHO2_01_FULL_64_10]OGR96320.1 MAG: hypothetical protein A2902_03450 [Elusimicrobia bacterium RIFCSPLOWO2_01_FULL_64_13]